MLPAFLGYDAHIAEHTSERQRPAKPSASITCHAVLIPSPVEQTLTNVLSIMSFTYSRTDFLL